MTRLVLSRARPKRRVLKHQQDPSLSRSTEFQRPVHQKQHSKPGLINQAPQQRTALWWSTSTSHPHLPENYKNDLPLLIPPPLWWLSPHTHKCTAVKAPWLRLRFLLLLFNAHLLHWGPYTALQWRQLTTQTPDTLTFRPHTQTSAHTHANTHTHTVQSCK